MLPNTTAVIDTNVMLDVDSCHDLANEHLKGGDVAGPAANYKRARARESLMLAIYLHKGWGRYYAGRR